MCEPQWTTHRGWHMAVFPHEVTVLFISITHTLWKWEYRFQNRLLFAGTKPTFQQAKDQAFYIYEGDENEETSDSADPPAPSDSSEG